jgi:hypothetical protein
MAINGGKQEFESSRKKIAREINNNMPRNATKGFYDQMTQQELKS